MLTPEEYAERRGLVCPVCESDDLEPGAIETHEGGAEQDMECCACGATWTDVLNLTGYTKMSADAD